MPKRKTGHGPGRASKCLIVGGGSATVSLHHPVINGTATIARSFAVSTDKERSPAGEEFLRCALSCRFRPAQMSRWTHCAVSGRVAAYVNSHRYWWGPET
jgi:hypothetical protein